MNFFLAAMCHFAADVGLQPTHVAQAKYKHWQPLLTHSVCSCSLIGLVGYFTMGYPNILNPWIKCLVAHIFIDGAKKIFNFEGTSRVIASYVDQALHLLYLYIIFGM